MKELFLILFVSLCVTARAQLTITVSQPKTTGQKAVVQLTMKNELTNTIESARAICFLLNEQGKMIGQSSKWVIGGAKGQPALKPNDGAKFNFVITSPQPFTTTNLTAKVSFSRLILEGGKPANLMKDVSVTEALQR